ncbi:MAG TPA: hypothetical protein VHF89_19545 [Solirubrobacteraceae bacterium]|nr:hypothetical protein [Solirubrobacteraceae bacterium]
MRLLPVLGLAALAFAAAPAAHAQQDPPPGFQLDLRGQPGVHAECFLGDGTLTCALYGGRIRGDARCDVGGVVPTVVWRPGAPPRHGHLCVDEGFHGWRRLREGSSRRLGGFRCTSGLRVVSGRVRGHLECLADGPRGFRVEGNRAVDLDAEPLPRRTLRSCRPVAFTPNSDDGAGGIRAQGTTCRTARRVARASRDHGPTRRPYRYRARGFRCRGRDDETQQLPTVRWECVRGSRLVVFDRT